MKRFSEQDVAEIQEIIRNAPRPPELRGHVVALEGDVLVFEYEHPGGRIKLGVRDEIQAVDDELAVGTVDWSRSSPPGHYAAGAVVRLALHRAGGWSLGKEVHLFWPNGHLKLFLRSQ